MRVRKWLLIVLALAMILGAALTWGSLGSVVLVFGLITMAASLMYQHFLTNRDEDDFSTGE